MGLFIRYVVSGLIAAGSHYAVLVSCVEGLRVDATLASALGFCVGLVVNYNLQYRWTFQSSGPHHKLFVRYLSVSAVTLGVNTLIFWYLYAVTAMPYPIAQAVAIGIVFIVNFNANRYYTFRAEGPRKDLATPAE